MEIDRLAVSFGLRQRAALLRLLVFAHAGQLDLWSRALPRNAFERATHPRALTALMEQAARTAGAADLARFFEHHPEWAPVRARFADRLSRAAG